MPQSKPSNPEEIDTANSNSKRVLDHASDPASSSSSTCSPSDLTFSSPSAAPPKKQKVADRDEVINAQSQSAPPCERKNEGDDANVKTTIDGPSSSGSSNNNKVDPTELASAFALASLASLSPGKSMVITKDLSTEKDPKHQEGGGGGVRNMESWEEARSPKADHHTPHSPEQRSPGSAMGTPPSAMSLEDRSASGGSRKVTFAPNTKETSSASPSTPLRVRLAASRRLAMPIHRSSMPPPSSSAGDGGMVVSPRPHRMYGGMPPPPYVRTPPHLPSVHMHPHGPPPPPPPPPPPHRHHHHLRHPAFHHPHHPGPMHHGGGAFHPSPPPPHYGGSPGGGWHHPRMGYPPRHLLQPPLMHPPVEPPPPPSKAFSQDSNQWICDFCNVASFGTYEEACIHEESCKLRVLSMSSSGEDLHRQRNVVAVTRSRSHEEAADTAEVYSSVPATDVKERDWFDGAMSLAMEESDPEWLSELNCYLRKYCVEVFSATAADVASTSNRNRVSLQQVGVRCCFCADHNKAAAEESDKAGEAGDDEAIKESSEGSSNKGLTIAAAVSFPLTITGIYESVKRWQRVHLEVCTYIPEEVRDQLSTLANTNVWVPTTRQYWADSARALGLVDTTEGIRFGTDPAKVHEDVNRIAKVPSGEEQSPLHPSRGMGYAAPPAYPPGMMHHHRSPPPSYPHPGMLRMDHLHQAVRVISQEGSITASAPPTSPSLALHQQHQHQQHVSALGGYIVFPQDMEMIPPYVYFLMRQVEPCLFTEADRFVARSKGPVGYPGFQCRHCNGHAGLGKYFPVSSKSLSTNSTSQNIHAHLLKCRKCPDAVKDRLVQLKIEKSRSPRLEPGWRKIFFDKVWARLHHPGPALAAPAAEGTVAPSTEVAEKAKERLDADAAAAASATERPDVKEDTT